MVDLSLNLKGFDKSYNIFVDNYSSLDFALKVMENTSGKKVLVVISEKVNKLYGKMIFPLFVNSGLQIFKYVLRDGEKYKNFKSYERILNFALKCGLTRRDCVWAIGGGVVGDLAGFVAATYMRGIDLIQIPTTLLACVDSSVGGKTAIDTDFGKNLVGAFYQPKAVIVNVGFLATLDKKQFRTGLGEVLKYAFIEKSCRAREYNNLVNFLSENHEKIMKKDIIVLKHLIENCIALKIAVVEQDEKESDLRRILNFGHTYGHALEKFTNYRKYTHGEAVAQGIIMAFEIAYKKGLIDENYKFAALQLLEKYGFTSIKLPKLEKMLNLMKLDKKATFDSVVFVLPNDFGQVCLQPLNLVELID